MKSRVTHTRTYSGSVRSLVDSPGSASTSESDNGDDHHDDESTSIFGDLSSAYGGSHGTSVISRSSTSDLTRQISNGYHSHSLHPKVPLHEQSGGSDGAHGSSGNSRQQHLLHPYSQRHPHRIRVQKENKKPRKLIHSRDREQATLSRQSTFESTVTATSSVSEINDNVSVKSWRSKHSHQSGYSNRIQEEEEEDQSTTSSSSHSRHQQRHNGHLQHHQDTLILDMQHIQSHRTPELNSNGRRIEPTTNDAIIMGKMFGGGSSNKADNHGSVAAKTNTNANALILQSSNGVDPSTLSNIHSLPGITPVANNNSSRIKNLLSSVHQLPRPRLIPFSPLVTTATVANTENDASSNNPRFITAASFAKDAPKAGYMSKLGSSVSEYKRRFFVLKPTTCLYYFLSPDDEEPRGCIDLDDKNGEGLKVNSLGSLPDGRFRFEVLLPIPIEGFTGQSDEYRKQQHRKILLEARNEEVGREWMQSLTEERLSYSKASIERLQKQVDELQSEKKHLTSKLEEMRLVEKDRDGAIQDANEWRERSQKLDRGLIVLKRWVSRPVSDVCDNPGDGNSQRSKDDDTKTPHSKRTRFSINEVDEELDEIDLPGTNFASLSNACRGLRENLSLASVETASALEDLHDANKKLKELENRMVKAEKYICKMWEENCSIRESLKKKKSEKKLLVKEVRSLIQKASDDHNEIVNLQKKNKLLAKATRSVRNTKHAKSPNEEKGGNGVRPSGKRQLNTPEMKLLSELEDHVSNSLIEHEYLLNGLYDSDEPDGESTEEPTKTSEKVVTTSSATTVTTVKESNSTVDDATSASLPHKMFDARDFDSSDEEVPITNGTLFSPLMPKQLSLMDQIALGEGKDEKKVSPHDRVHPPTTVSNKNKSVDSGLEPPRATVKGKQLSENENVYNNSDSNSSLDICDEGGTMKNPLDQLDAEVSRDTITPQDSQSLVTDNGKATSRLICPLNDVVQSTGKDSDDSIHGRDHQQVYSLTFYTPKIGLQFQKVPSNNRPNGILTEAMTADVEDDNESKSATVRARTDAELRLVASLSDPPNDPKSSEIHFNLKDHSCPVLLPKDYVLVCGYQGFDESSNNRKPSLGARLVGFDGISIERGPWTFEAVRRAIKARRRPLTLTFRDEYLNVEQRILLTKAVTTPNQPPRPQPHPTRHATIPAVINDVPKFGDGTMSSSSSSSIRVPRSPSFSDITLPKFSHNGDVHSHHDDSTISNCSPANFSDTGSSSTFSTKFSSFIPGLMSGLTQSNISNSEKRKQSSGGVGGGDDTLSFTPDYFRRSSDSLESSPHHKQFQAGLL